MDEAYHAAAVGILLGIQVGRIVLIASGNETIRNNSTCVGFEH